MEHLTREALARLVDEAPDEREEAHLAGCDPCRRELDALREQTAALSGLPDLLPPRGEWATLEARLRSEGLLRGKQPVARGSVGAGERSQLGQWRAVAAALTLFIGGTLVGAGATSMGSTALPGERSAGSDASSEFVVDVATLDDAVEQVRLAEQQYVAALDRYRQLLEASGDESVRSDPVSRFAALDALVTASQAAVREAPTDPFLNGMLISTVAERQATLRTISTNQNWY